MAITHVDSFGVNSGSGTATSLVITPSTDLVGSTTGDVVIVACHIGGTSLTASASTGWTALPDVTFPVDQGSASRIAGGWWRRLDGTADDTLTITISGSATGGATAVALRGALASGTPVAQAASATASAASIDLAALTGVAEGSALVALVHGRVASGTSALTGWTADADYTESEDHGTSRNSGTSQNVQMIGAYRLGVTAGDYSGDTFTTSGTASLGALVVEVTAEPDAVDTSAAAHTPVVEALIGSQWRTVPVRYGSGGGSAITVHRGRTGFSVGSTPTSAVVRIDNRDGEWSPRNATGSMYGLLNINTPLRVAVRPNAVTGSLADASDAFARAVASDWGTADVGGDWSLLGAGGTVANSDWDVTTGEATIYVPAANGYRFSYLGDLSILDCTQSITFAAELATGADLEPAALLFRGTGSTDYVMIRVHLTTANAVQVKAYAADDTLLGSATVSGLTHAGTGTPLRVTARTVGRLIFARVFDPSGAEPATWDLIAADTTAYPVPGWTGVRAGRATGNTNTTDPTVTYTNYSVTVDVPVCCVEIPSWPPSADRTGEDVWVEVQGSGVLRRLSVGGSRPAQSAIYRAIDAADPIAWWPLEDGEDAGLAASGLYDGWPLQIRSGVINFETTGGPAGASGYAALVEAAASVITGPIQVGTAGAWQLAFWAKGEGLESGYDEVEMVAIYTTSPSAERWHITLTDSGGGLSKAVVTVKDSTGTTVDSMLIAGSEPGMLDGEWHLYQLLASDSGSNVAYSLYIDGSLAGSDSVSSADAGAPIWVEFPAEPSQAETQNLGISHVAVWDHADLVSLYSAGIAHLGETAGARMVRLAEQAGIPFHLIGSADDTQPMGPQGSGTFLAEIEECVTADGGRLFEPASYVGLAYRTRADMYNQASSCDLDYSLAHLSTTPTPLPDDLYIRNLVTVSRPLGSSATAEVDSGSLSTSPPPPYGDGVGVYDHALSANVAADSDLPGVAGWVAALGTSGAPRFGGLAVKLHRSVFRASQPLTNSVRALEVDGRRATLANLPTYAGGGTAGLLLVGLSHFLDQFEHTMELHTEPDAVWSQIATLDDDDLGLIGSDGSTVASDFVSGTDTSLSVSVLTGRPLWVTGAVDFNVETGGVVLHVTNISGASSPQTFTVDATPVNGIERTITAGTSLDAYPQNYIGR